MHPIPGGSFFMGSTDSVYPFEQPLHPVTISAFWMDSTGVTLADYGSLRPLDSTLSWENSQLPIAGITWYDAMLYCNARSRRDGLDTMYSYMSLTFAGVHCIHADGLRIDYEENGYRLPTEAEREYAERAGTITKYFWGDSMNADYCWFAGNSGNVLHAVAGKKPNAWGLYDMSGNLWEWCNDWYFWYDSASRIDPVISTDTTFHVLRGGAYDDDADCLRSARRSLLYPPVDYYPAGDYGFRCIRRTQSD
jgi:formylglycine-generating enzyme required for sulfatase activity